MTVHNWITVDELLAMVHDQGYEVSEIEARDGRVIVLLYRDGWVTNRSVRPDAPATRAG